MLFVLFVSYAGSRGHRPRWIALGCVLMAVGSIVFIIPHFIANQYDYRAVGKCGTNILGTETLLFFVLVDKTAKPCGWQQYGVLAMSSFMCDLNNLCCVTF